nr:MORN repeat-containing protein [Marseillevirus sp.]
MLSLKLLCAVHVSEKTGVQELDEIFDEIQDFAAAGKDGTIQGTFFVHSVFVQKYLGWKPFQNGDSKFYLNKEGQVCGLLRGDRCGGTFGKETMYLNGKKHGLEIIRRCSSFYGRTETHWRNGKKHGKSTEYGYANNILRDETYKDDLLDGEFRVFHEYTGDLLLRLRYKDGKPI